MIRPYLTCKKFLLAGVLSFFVFSLFAADRYSVATGNWNSTSTWSASSGGASGASFPVAGDNVFLENGYTVTVTANAACANITFTGVGAAATLTVNSSVTVTVSAAVTLYKLPNADNSCTVSGSGTLSCANLAVGSAINSPTTNGTTRTHTFNSLIAALNISGNLSINSYFTNNNRIRNGVFDLESGTVTVTGSVTTTNENSANTSTFSMTAGAQTGTLILSGATPFSISGTGTSIISLNGTSTLVNYNRAGNQPVYSSTYTNLTISGSGTKSLQGNTQINNILTLTSGTLSVGAYTLTLNGPTIAGTPSNLSTTSSSSLEFGGSSSGVLIPSSVTALNGLSITNTNIVTLQSSLTVSGTFNPSGAGLSIGANTLTLNGQINCGTLSGGATSNISIGGSGTASLSAVTLNNLTINRAVSLCGNVTVGGTLTLTSGTFAIGANTLTLNGPAIAGTPSNLSTTSSSSLVFGGSSSGVLIPSSVTALNGLSITNTNIVALQSSLTVSGTFNPSGAGLSIGSNTLTLNGQVNCGALSGGATSNISIGGSGTASLSAVTLNNLTINRALSLCGNVTVGGTLTLTSGSFTIGANTLTLNGPAIAGTPSNLSTSSSSSLSFGGSSSGILVPASIANLNNLTVNNSSGITLNSNVTVAGTLTMTQGNIFSGSYTLTLSTGSVGSLSYTSGTITGKFQRALGSASTEYLFPVGTATVYNPFKITCINLVTGQLSVQFLPDDIGTAGLPLNDSGTIIYNRQTTGYWTLTAIAPMASTNYNIKLDYSGFTGVDANARIIKRTNGGNLSLDGSHGTLSGSEISRTGLNGISTTTTDFAIGSPGPRITSQPVNSTGCNSSFGVVVSGNTPLSYQWQENNGGGFANITNGGIYSGSTSATLTISGASMSMNGYQYRCIVTDALGYVTTSNSATLTLTVVSLGYTYVTDIVLDPASGASDLTDFPALISITTSPGSTRLRSIANGGRLYSTSGYDVIFTDQNGSQLDHQLESYDAVTGQYIAWVRIPVLSHATTTTIKMLYGNPSISTNPSVKSTWTSNYKGVWHLNGSDYTDGTINSNDGTQSNTTSVTGKIAGARGFNGTTSYIITPTNGCVPNNNNQTVSIWANYSSTPTGNRNLITFQNQTLSSAIQLGFRGGNAVAWKWGGTIMVDGGPAPSTNTWHYYVYTFDGTTSRYYIDGVEVDNSTVAPQTALPSECNIGRYNNGEYLAANLDEPRFSMSPKSAGWVLTEYNNQNDPSGFISLGAENINDFIASVGVCLTSYTLNQGYPAGGTYSGTGVSGTVFNASVAGVGTHSITYTYTDAYGCTNNVSKNIIVTAIPSAPTSSSRECCYQNILDLEATGTNIRWYTDAGLTTLAGTGTPFATGKTTAGIYPYYVTQTINQCQSISTTVSLTIYNGITIASQPQPQTICNGDNALFSVSSTGYNLTYRWQENGVNISNGGIYSGATTSTLVLTNPGLTKNGSQYRCVITTSCGTSPVNSNAALLTVTVQPAATFSYTGTPYCPNAPNPFPTFSGGGVAGTFSSTPGLVFVSTATGEINIGASIPGSYIVTNTVPASGGCLEAIATNPVSIITDITWTGAVDTDWNTAGNWTCALIPGPSTPVQLPNVINQPVLSTGATGTVNNLTIEAGSSLTISGNTLQISGTITNNGIFDASAGTIVMNGTAAQSIPASAFTSNTLENLTVNNTSGVSLLGTLNVTGIVNVQNGNLSSGGFLTLVSTASGTALVDGSGSGSVSGNVTMQRYLPSAFGYKYIGSPFQAATVNEFADEIDLGDSWPTFYRYDESKTTSGWTTYITPTDPLNPLAGYAANFGSSGVPLTADASGVVNNGSLSATLYNHNNTYTLGFNLVGNPYPSPIDWDAISGWTKTNIDDALYYFKASTTDEYGGRYSSYINGISSDDTVSNIIPSMQGFFVHVTNGTYPVTATLGLDNRVRVTDANQIFAKSGEKGPVPLLRVGASFEEVAAPTDPLVIYFNEKAGTGFDPNLDALKLTNTDYYIPSFYSIGSDGSKLSINALQEIPDSICRIPLGIKTYLDGYIVFRIIDISEVLAGKKVYLTDQAEGTDNDLLGNKEYRVFLQEGEYKDRFFLNLSSVATTIPEIPSDNDLFSVYSSHGVLKTYVNTEKTGKGTLSVINATGQTFFVTEIIYSGYSEFNPGLKDGIYIVTFASPSYRASKKIIIQNR